MENRTSVLLLIPHLGGGGAERVTHLLACGLDPARFDVHLGLITERNAEGSWLPAWVAIHGLGARRVRYGAMQILRLVRRLRPDIIVCGMAHLNLLVLLLRPLFPLKTRVLVRQNSQPHAKTFGRRLPLSYRVLYPTADAVICQTPEMSVELAEIAQRGGRLCVLPNPLDVEAIRREARSTDRAPWNGPGPHLLAVGRLAHEKGFDLLLGAFAMLRKHYPRAELAILGEGRELPLLRSLTRIRRLGSSVRFAGRVAHPAQWYRGATLFVLSSREDALPNALLEAAAGGLPIVTTAASSGLVELVKGQRGVWIATETSSAGILGALQAALNAIRSGERYPHLWTEPFRKESALAAYEGLIQSQMARELS